VPDQSRLLSDYNSKVEKEMVSAMNRPPQPAMTKSDRKLISPGDDKNGSASAQRRAASKKARRFSPQKKEGDAEREGTKPGERVKKASKTKQTNKPSKNKLVKGEGPFAPGGEKLEERATAVPGDGGGPMGGSPEPESWTALLPTLGPEELERKDGSIDHIEDVDKGAQTFLNTRDYKYAWFFNRVKRGVRQRWRAVEAHRRNDPYGRIHGVRDRRTEVEVTLTSSGALEDIIVLKDSGVAFLDDAAVTAFEEAAPFPNPPDGLKDADGKIRFRFAFFLEIDSRGLRFLPRRRR
jgi:TonB family protein